MSRRDELFATRFIDLPGDGISPAAQQRMARELGADSLRYLPVEAIARSVSLPPDRLCRACITGRYPTSAGQRLYQIDANTSDPCHANGAGGPRTYELSAVAGPAAE
jgi:amidophosphoribosyltransferase